MANDEGPVDEMVEHEGERLLARSFRPVIVLAPLTLAVLIPSIVYGWYSSQAADEAFGFVEQALVVDADGTNVDPDSLCDGVTDSVSDLKFYELAENLDEARSSLSNVGFGAANVDFRGWLDPPIEATADDSGSTTKQDVRDDITFSLTRSGESWCIEDIVVR